MVLVVHVPRQKVHMAVVVKDRLLLLRLIQHMHLLVMIQVLMKKKPSSEPAAPSLLRFCVHHVEVLLLLVILFLLWAVC